MKPTELRVEEERSTRPDASAARPADGNQPTANINDILRQIIREDSRRSIEK